MTEEMTRHIRGELSRATDTATQEIDYLIDRLAQAKAEVARDPSWASSSVSSLGQAMSQVSRALAELAAKNAAVETLKLMNGDEK